MTTINIKRTLRLLILAFSIISPFQKDKKHIKIAIKTSLGYSDCNIHCHKPLVISITFTQKNQMEVWNEFKLLLIIWKSQHCEASRKVTSLWSESQSHTKVMWSKQVTKPTIYTLTSKIGSSESSQNPPVHCENL